MWSPGLGDYFWDADRKKGEPFGKKKVPSKPLRRIPRSTGALPLVPRVNPGAVVPGGRGGINPLIPWAAEKGFHWLRKPDNRQKVKDLVVKGYKGLKRLRESYNDMFRKKVKLSMWRGGLRRRGGNGGTTTSKYKDFGSSYRSGRTSRYRRKRGARFSARVNSVIAKDTALKTFVDNASGLGTTGVNTQSIVSFNLYGCITSVGPTFLAKAFANEFGAVPSKTLFFKKAKMFFSFSADVDNAYPLFIDAYLCRAKDEIPSVYSNMGAVFDDFASVGPLPIPSSGDVSFNSTNAYTTPFQNPLFCHWFKVLKVTKHKLEPGSTTTFSLSKTLNRKITYDEITNVSILRGGIGYLFLIYGAPSSDGSTGSVNASSQKWYLNNSQYLSWRLLSQEDNQGLSRLV